MSVPIIDVPGTTEAIAKRNQSVPIVNVPGLEEAIQKRNEKPVSPTGAPVIPVAAVPWLVGVVSLAGVLSETLPQHTIGAQVAKVVFSIGCALGWASPGLRKH